jgi:membrane associated rhomboid family serine protease
MQNVQLFTFPTLVGVTDPVTSALLQVWGSQLDAGIGARIFYLYFNGAQVGSNWGEFFNSFPGYIGDAAYTAVAPTLAQVNGQHGFIGFGSGGPANKWTVSVTMFYRLTTFVYAAGTSEANFAHLVGCLMGALGAGLLLRDMPGIARAIARRTGTLILPSEYADALRAWRRERHVAVA